MRQVAVERGKQARRVGEKDVTAIGNMPFPALYRFIRGRITKKEQERFDRGDNPPLPAYLVTREDHARMAQATCFGFSDRNVTLSLGQYPLPGAQLHDTVGVQEQRKVEAVIRYAKEVGFIPPGTDKKVRAGTILQTTMWRGGNEIPGTVELFVQVGPESLPSDFQRFRPSPAPK